MKRLSHKDLIIALGIAVAAIILVSSIYFESSNQTKGTQPAPTGKPKPTVVIKKVLEKLATRTHL